MQRRRGAPRLAFSAVAIVNNAPVALSTVNLQFSFDRPRASGEFSTLPVWPAVFLSGSAGLPVSNRARLRGPIAVRVTATDPGGLSVTNTFTINVAVGGFRRTGRGR